jgi:hypothetical protein
VGEGGDGYGSEPGRLKWFFVHNRWGFWLLGCFVTEHGQPGQELWSGRASFWGWF